MKSLRTRAVMAAAIAVVGALSVANVASVRAASIVEVYQTADSSSLTVGQTTTVHVYADITNTDYSDGVFAFDFNVNAVENSAYSVGSVTNDAEVPGGTATGSSGGINDIEGYYFTDDTVGLNAPVELFSYEITGTAVGSGTLGLAPDTTAGLGSDGIYLLSESPGSGYPAPTKTIDGPITIDVTGGSGSPVPEPASLGLLGIGLAAAGLRRRR